jgi:outer membrane protein
MKREYVCLALGALLAGLWAGCVSPTTPSSVSAPWRAPERAEAKDPEWAALRAERPDFSRPLTLGELSDLALRSNPGTRAAWNQARAAAARVEQTKGLFIPNLTAVGQGTRQRVDANDAAMDQDYLQYGPALRLSYLVINFGGGRAAAVEQALQTVYAANYAFNRSLQAVLFSVQGAYYGVVSAQAATEVAETNVRDAGTVLDAASARLQQGLGTELDVLQAQAALDQARFQRAGAQGLVQNARAGLAQALGQPADAPVQVAPPGESLPAVPDALELSRLIDATLARRPDIASLRARVAAAEASVRVTAATQWPSLYLTGSVARDYSDVYNEGGQPMAEEKWSYTGGLSLQWPFFDGGQTINARRAAEAQADALRSQLRQAELAASADVWTGHHSLVTALQKVEFSEAFLRSAQASHAMALDSYKAGLKSLLDVLNAETQLAQARGQQVAVRQEAFTAFANLAYATGQMEIVELTKPVQP